MPVIWNLIILLMGLIYLIYRVSNVKKPYSYPLIENNTIFYYLLIFSAITISFYLVGRITISAVFLSCLIYLILFSVHEIQWYLFHTQLLKDESESTQNFYNWTNNMDDGIIKDSALIKDGYDFSEGIFDGDFTLSNQEAMQKKYDLYYEYLKLKPGMKLLDIGCGNGHWGDYLKKKGIDFTGIVISEENYAQCKRKGLKVILGDARIVIKDMKERFDAISAIGSVEHFASVSQPHAKRVQALHDYFMNVVSLIDINSTSRMYLNSIMTINLSASRYKTLEFYFYVYLICSVFGTGYYPSDHEIEDIYNSAKSKITVKRDYTEDYRYIHARNDKYLGSFKLKYHLNSLKKIFYLLKVVLSDPYWIHRIMFELTGAWLWQFGGNNKMPMPNFKDTPIRAYVYVIKIGPPQ